MKDIRCRRYYAIVCATTALASFYPLYMGIRVLADMIRDGTVMKENYPKYIIPYTPICVALLAGVLLMPLLSRIYRRLAFAVGSALSVGVFFAFETLLERRVVVTSAETVSSLRDWQMFMCYIPPESTYTEYKTQTAVDILMGEYDPSFKLHFYVISVIIILAVLNCLYGFWSVLRTGSKRRVGALILQSAAAFLFTGMCILACFTAFWRDGGIEVSPLSAVLMCAFFVLMGLVGGIGTGSFLIGRGRWLSVFLPALVSSALTALMYVGEALLLNGHLYRLGSGAFFESMPWIIVSAADILVIVASGAICALLLGLVNKKRR